MTAAFATAGHSADSPERTLAPPSYLPAAPRSLAEFDISENLLTDIALRHVSHRGTVTIQQLANLMKLPAGLAEALYRRLSEQGYFDLRRMSGDDYLFGLSPAGRKLAAERSVSFRYAGPTPVSLDAWTAAVRAQTAQVAVSRGKLRGVLSDIVVPDDLLDAIGPALISRNAMFLYGESGTGKTAIAERLLRVFDDAVVVPWAIEADGQIITVADPVVHQPVEFPELDVDPRWLVCRRPFVAVGGELVTGMLDLRRDEANGFYSAPLQMKANNGMLLIDDFGRQMISPRDLLNRWIVPLDRRIDFLSLNTGAKLDIPFEVQVVFSTNLAPQELADEAFLRRIPNKILVPPVGAPEFDRIFELNASSLKMGFEPGVPAYFRELCLRHSSNLRPCFARDICRMIHAITRYDNRPPVISKADLERAIARYFL